MSDDVPPGWSENPTAWSTRLPLAALALVGLAVAGYLTLYQVDALSNVWDPFFPHGSPQVLDLTSPVPDAAAGVLAYASEVVLSFIGGADRWRTMPWTALAFGAVVLSGALVSVMLIVIQPTVVGHGAPCASPRRRSRSPCSPSASRRRWRPASTCGGSPPPAGRRGGPSGAWRSEEPPAARAEPTACRRGANAMDPHPVRSLA